MALRFSLFVLCGEVQNSSRFRISNSANKPRSQGHGWQRYLADANRDRTRDQRENAGWRLIPSNKVMAGICGPQICD